MRLGNDFGVRCGFNIFHIVRHVLGSQSVERTLGVCRIFNVATFLTTNHGVADLSLSRPIVEPCVVVLGLRDRTPQRSDHKREVSSLFFEAWGGSMFASVNTVKYLCRLGFELSAKVHSLPRL